MRQAIAPKLKLFVLALTVILPLGCSSKAPRTESGIHTAYVLKAKLDTFSATHSHEANAMSFELGRAEFHSLLDVDHLDGKYFKVIRGGRLTVSAVEGSIVTSNGFVGEEVPHLNYHLDSQGTIVPNDQSSLAMLSALYQMDWIVDHLREATGLDMDALHSIYGNISILFEPEILINSRDISASATLKLNAAFDPARTSFLIFRRSSIERTPLGANLQVLAHEFGHFIWHHHFSTNLGAAAPSTSLDETQAIRGLNEGFADFVSFTFTGSADVLGGSLPSDLVNTQQRNFSSSKFKYGYVDGNGADQCEHRFYCLGTLFAKSLLEAAKVRQLDLSTLKSRGNYLKSILAALKNTRSGMPTTVTTQTLDSVVLGAFFHSFLLNVSDQDLRGSICSELVRNFGDHGFSPTDRVGCL